MAKIRTHGWWRFSAKDLKETTDHIFHLILSFMNIHAKLRPLAVFIHVVGGISILRDGQNQNTMMAEIFSKRSERNNKLDISFNPFHHAKLHPLAVSIHVVGGISVLWDGQNQNTWMVEIFSKRSERNNRSYISFNPFLHEYSC